SYYDDDVLYFEDHGVENTSFGQGYSFAELANTRTGANAATADVYSILVPGGAPVLSGAGGDGVNPNPQPVVSRNYGFAVRGIEDPEHETLPVTLAITGSSSDGVANTPDPWFGFNFESPAIGDCTNLQPESMEVRLQASVSGLTPGVDYNLYEYDFTRIDGIGVLASLEVPDRDFNARADQARRVTRFTAKASTFTTSIETRSDTV